MPVDQPATVNKCHIGAKLDLSHFSTVLIGDIRPSTPSPQRSTTPGFLSSVVEDKAVHVVEIFAYGHTLGVQVDCTESRRLVVVLSDCPITGEREICSSAASSFEQRNETPSAREIHTR